MRNWFAPAFFILSVGFGLWVNDRSWNGQVFVYIGEQRAPASTRQLGEYSTLNRSALHQAVQTQLLANAEVFKQSGQVGIQLGHPLLDRKGGGKEFGCQVQDHSGAYDRMELVFIGTGVSSGGEPPRMVIDTGCRSQSDLSRLDTIWIPMDDIFASTAKDQELQMGGDNPSTIKLESIPDAWPENWVLWSVKLYHEQNPDESLLIDASLLRQARPQLLSFDWPNAQ